MDENDTSGTVDGPFARTVGTVVVLRCVRRRSHEFSNALAFGPIMLVFRSAKRAGRAVVLLDRELKAFAIEPSVLLVLDFVVVVVVVVVVMMMAGLQIDGKLDC